MTSAALVKIGMMLMVFGKNNLLNMEAAREAIAGLNQQTAGVVELDVRKTARQRRDPCSRHQGIKARYGKYACMKQWAYAHGYLRERRLFSGLIEPAVDDAGVWSYGFASGTCDLRYGFTMSTFAAVNAFGVDRREYSILALIHELLHLLGAKHIDDFCNAMHPNALACIASGEVDLLPESLSRVRNCTWRNR